MQLPKFTKTILTPILLTWTIWWAPNNASRWQMEFNSVFKWLKFCVCDEVNVLIYAANKRYCKIRTITSTYVVTTLINWCEILTCLESVTLACISERYGKSRGTRWRSWLRHCTTSQKVAGSNPDGATGIFLWHNSSGRTMALGLTQPLIEMSTRNISWK
jgi:hypothetical protein